MFVAILKIYVIIIIRGDSMGINEFIQIGDKIKSFRKRLNLTQEEMSIKLSIPRSTYANYESNKREPSSTIINKICTIMDISPFMLIGENTLLENINNESLKNDSLITKMFLENEEHFFSNPTQYREQQEWLTPFISFMSSKSLQGHLGYTEDEISKHLPDLYTFTLQMLDLKIKEIKYKNLLKNK